MFVSMLWSCVHASASKVVFPEDFACDAASALEKVRSSKAPPELQRLTFKLDDQLKNESLRKIIKRWRTKKTSYLQKQLRVKKKERKAETRQQKNKQNCCK